MELPLGCSSLHPRCVFDSWSSRTSPNPNFKTDEEFLTEFSYLLDITEKEKAFTTHYFDPWHMVKHGLLSRMGKLLKDKDLELMTYRQFLGNKRKKGGM